MGRYKKPKRDPWKTHKWNRYRYDPFGSKMVRLEFRKPLNDRLPRFLLRRTPASIRVSAQLLTPNRWGHGLDEMVQTRLLSGNPKGFKPQEIGELHQHERMHTTDLIWATGPGGTSPLAGHTPALKNHQGRSMSGTVTEEHGTRDNLREQAILQESKATDWGIKARLATVKYMMSPGEELRAQESRLKKHGQPLFSVHTRIGDLRKPKELGKLSDRQQEIREKIKWHTAAEMLHRNHGELVPDTFKSFLSQHKHPDTAMDAFRRASILNPKIVQNRSTTSQTDDLSTQSLATMKTGVRQRALSNARLLPPVKPIL